MISKTFGLVVVVFLYAATATATIFGSVRGVVHDPQHRPIDGAMVMLKSRSSDWGKSANTDASGEFGFNGVPIGDYSITVSASVFSVAMVENR
jgi:hypothetical protein